MLYQALITVSYKKSILEPQGQAVLRLLNDRNEKTIQNIRIGKSIEIILEASSTTTASEKVKQLVDELLCNPNIETYTFEIREDSCE